MLGGNDADEYLLRVNPDRISLFPIVEKEIWKFYKKAESAFWVTASIDMTQDLKEWPLLTQDERDFLSKILGFFAGSDFIVNDNLAVRFLNEVQIPEAKAFYIFQQTMEQIHTETYGMLIDVLIKDPDEKKMLFNAVKTIPCIEKKSLWARKWITSSDCFAMRLVGMACCEGIFFSGSFCALFWLKKRGLMPGIFTIIIIKISVLLTLYV